MEGYQQERVEEWVEKVQGIRSIIGRYKIGRGRLITVWRSQRIYMYDPWT